MFNTLEIYYDIAAVPGIEAAWFKNNAALKFRNAAMARIEAALQAAGAGEWVGAEIGDGEINFGFDVDDFDRAEAVVREAVAGTPYACIRTIERRSFNPADYQPQ